MRKQNKLIIKSLLLAGMIAAFSTGTRAAVATVYATRVPGYSNQLTCEADTTIANCDFVKSGSSGRIPLNKTGLQNTVSSDVGTFVYSPSRASAWIDLGFGTNKVVTGPGADLVIFSVGNGYRFGLNAYGQGNTLLSSFNYSVPADGSSQAVDSNGNLLYLKDGNGNAIANISATAINLLDVNKNVIADNTAISYIRLFIGTDYNGTDLSGNATMPLFSLAGAFHTSPVPLPLPLLLFSSGLIFLGWFGRRKRI